MLADIETGSETGPAARPGAGRDTPWWLITRVGNGEVGVLILPSRGRRRRTLPVFSFEKEAELFLRLGGSRETGG